MPAYDAPGLDLLGASASARTLVADRSTGRHLVWSVTRFVVGRWWFWRPYAAVVLGVSVAAVVSVVFAQDDDSGQGGSIPLFWPAFLLVVVVGRLAYDAVRLARSARSAPAGAALRWVSSERGVHLQHATASVTLPWTLVAQVHVVGRSVLLLLPGGITPLPRELLGDDLDRVRRRVRTTAAPGGGHSPGDAPDPFVSATRLRHVLRCTPSTGRRQYLEYRRRQVRRPVVGATTLALLGSVTVAVLEPSGATVVLAVSLVALAVQWVSSVHAVRSQLDRSFPPGSWVAADLVSDELVVEDPQGRVSLSLSGLRAVRERPGGLLVASVSGEGVALPHDLLPSATVARLRTAARRPGAG